MISGDLSVFPLLPVLQMLLSSGKGGLFAVDHARGGELWFDHGEILHARSGQLSGERALQLLASLDGGNFTFEPDVTPPEQTLSLRQDSALHQLFVEAGSWGPLLQVMPDWNAPLRFSDRWTPQQPVTRTQYRVLSLIDGRRSLRTLIDLSDLPPITAAATYTPFVSGGLLEFAGR